ncbi:hypothetical protein NHX12_030620 [Muraenolepis orangiensis]|uniref:Uncharacterized protein n=1 Tax=Muraenolepis orangiensis TaxID=630683 RepID=A0A9Q0ILT8_9TELE|nr:hypothetical protein NHX12_030620 [Muraenolepis orangiensis]
MQYHPLIKSCASQAYHNELRAPSRDLMDHQDPRTPQPEIHHRGSARDWQHNKRQQAPPPPGGSYRICRGAERWQASGNSYPTFRHI